MCVCEGESFRHVDDIFSRDSPFKVTCPQKYWEVEESTQEMFYLRSEQPCIMVRSHVDGVRSKAG